jgi:opacity protein-like surface antigen
MRRTAFSALVGAALFILPSAVAVAADMPQMPPTPHIGGGWYLRGDIGFSNQQVGSLFNALYDDPDIDFVTNINKGFSAAPFMGVGIGYQYSDHFRVDFTGEYRGGADFHGLDLATTTVPNTYDDQYTAIKKEWTFLANAYWDIGNYRGFKPFIGAGIGTSLNTISDFMDVGTTIPSVATGAKHSQWNLAWALYAGVGYQITPNLTLEAAYRYINLGNAASGDLIAMDGTNDVYNPMEFHHLTSHDFKIGFRYAFDQPSYYPPVVKY